MAMGRSGSQELKPLRVARDPWRATTRAGAAIAARQAARLETLVWHARLASRFYADHYREVSPGLIGPRGALPPAADHQTGADGALR